MTKTRGFSYKTCYEKATLHCSSNYLDPESGWKMILAKFSANVASNFNAS